VPAGDRLWGPWVGGEQCGVHPSRDSYGHIFIMSEGLVKLAMRDALDKVNTCILGRSTFCKALS
jgi:hypothetical protein